jgi:hypothetical protein
LLSWSIFAVSETACQQRTPTACCCRLQQQAKQQEQQLLQVDDLLTHSTTNWFGRQQLPYRDLLAVLTGSKTVTSG